MIEVGELIRTKNGYIGKIENINDFRPPESKYAVDIQAEDPFVKGQINLWTDIELRDVYGDYDRLKYTAPDIKDIVTMEQFEQIKYKVKENI